MVPFVRLGVEVESDVCIAALRTKDECCSRSSHQQIVSDAVANFHTGRAVVVLQKERSGGTRVDDRSNNLEHTKGWIAERRSKITSRNKIRIGSKYPSA